MAVLPMRDLPRYRLAEASQDIRGLAVVTDSGERLGTVVELKVNTLTDLVEVAVLDNGEAIPIHRLERQGNQLTPRSPA